MNQICSAFHLLLLAASQAFAHNCQSALNSYRQAKKGFEQMQTEIAELGRRNDKVLKDLMLIDPDLAVKQEQLRAQREKKRISSLSTQSWSVRFSVKSTGEWSRN